MENCSFFQPDFKSSTEFFTAAKNLDKIEENFRNTCTANKSEKAVEFIFEIEIPLDLSKEFINFIVVIMDSS